MYILYIYNLFLMYYAKFNTLKDNKLNNA